MRVEAFAGNDDVESGVVIRPRRKVRAVREFRREPHHADVAKGTEGLGTVDGDAEHVVASEANGS